MGEQGVVVIPAYREMANIANVIAGVRAQLPGAQILVVDDCSPDCTAEVVREAGAIVLRLPINLGDGAARQTGFKYAARLDAIGLSRWMATASICRRASPFCWRPSGPVQPIWSSGAVSWG